MKPPVIHVGYPKAASSLLQTALFARHPDINFLSHHVDPDERSECQAASAPGNLTKASTQPSTGTRL